MLASWPMVIGALIAGVLVGLLVPSPKPASTPVVPPLVNSEKSDAKAKRETSAPTKEKDSVATKESPQGSAPAQPAAESKSAKQDPNPCSQQTWPYYSPSCIDRSAPAPATFQVTNTRPADPAIALREEKKQASAPDPARQPPKATPPAPAQAGAPVQANTAPAQPPTQPQTPARAQSRAPDNAQASSGETERQFEQPRQRQQQRTQPRFTRIDPPDDDDSYESPRVRQRSDGTRVYVLPERPAPRGYWRSW
jgi:hypothetical protein